MTFFTPHARERAKERYGLELTIPDLSFIAHACNLAKAALLRVQTNGAKVYCVEVRGVKTFPVISHDRVIVTFQPPDFLVASVARKHRRETIKKWPRSPRFGRSPAYEAAKSGFGGEE